MEIFEIVFAKFFAMYFRQCIDLWRGWFDKCSRIFRKREREGISNPKATLT